MKLKKQFQDFYDTIKITDETNRLQEKREVLQDSLKNNLPEKLEENGIAVNKTDLRFIDQGSYKYHTTINTSPVDRDVALLLPLSIGNTDPSRSGQCETVA